jgi:hypothetical protein
MNAPSRRLERDGRGLDRCNAMPGATMIFSHNIRISDEQVARVVRDIEAALAAPPTDLTWSDFHRALDGLRGPKPAPASPARKPRKPTFASVARAARRAGIDPARIEIRPDGTVVVTDKGEPQPSNDLDNWLKKKDAHQA